MSYKKIGKIDGCHHCPLGTYETRSGQSYCEHVVLDGVCVTGYEDIPRFCPLDDDD